MHLLASYRNLSNDRSIEHLPTITKDYIRRTILKNQRGETAPHPWKYWNKIEDWNSIFDNDGIGTFLHEYRWNFSQAFFDPSQYTFTWEKDAEGRLIPYINYSKDYEQLQYRINTLHVASKKLAKFWSLR